MKAMLVVVATCAVLAMSSVAQASLILVGGTPANSFVDLGGQGFGTAPRMLTLQTNGFESGFETPVDVEHGMPSMVRINPPRRLLQLGWASGAEVGIGFNSGQSGNTGITLQNLVLTIYDATGTTAIGSFSLAGRAPITFTAAELFLQQGNGNAVFSFGLDDAQQAKFNALRTMAGALATSQGLGHLSVARPAPLQAAGCRTMARIVSLAFVQSKGARAGRGFDWSPSRVGAVCLRSAASEAAHLGGFSFLGYGRIWQEGRWANAQRSFFVCDAAEPNGGR